MLLISQWRITWSWLNLLFHFPSKLPEGTFRRKMWIAGFLAFLFNTARENHYKFCVIAVYILGQKDHLPDVCWCKLFIHVYFMYLGNVLYFFNKIIFYASRCTTHYKNCHPHCPLRQSTRATDYIYQRQPEIVFPNPKLVHSLSPRGGWESMPLILCLTHMSYSVFCCGSGVWGFDSW